MIDMHNWGFDVFWMKVFSELGINLSRLFTTSVGRITESRKIWKNFHEKVDVKRRR